METGTLEQLQYIHPSHTFHHFTRTATDPSSNITTYTQTPDFPYPSNPATLGSLTSYIQAAL